MTEMRKIPFDLTAEKSLIGSVMVDPRILDDVRAIIPTPGFFWNDDHASAYAGILKLRDAKRPIDITTLINAVGSSIGRTAELITECLEYAPSAAHGEYYAAIVRDKALLRRLITIGDQTTQDAYDATDGHAAVLERAQKRIFEISKDRPKIGESFSISDSLHAAFEAMDKGTQGLPTGIKDLDNLTTGFHPGELIIIAARPSMGKSVFMGDIIGHIGVDLKHPCAMFSLEMNKEDVSQRMLCARANVDSQKLRRGALSIEERSALRYAVGEISVAPIRIDDTPGRSVSEIASQARRMVSEICVESRI